MKYHGLMAHAQGEESMETTKSTIPNAANLLETITCNVKTLMEMDGMVAIFKLETLKVNYVKTFQEDTCRLFKMLHKKIVSEVQNIRE